MHERIEKIELGVIETDPENRLVAYIEKPTYHYKVSMGIYVFESHVLQYIQPGQSLDFPDLLHILLQNHESVFGYPYQGYWRDVGRLDDYELAIIEFESMRAALFYEEPAKQHSKGGGVI